jgi:hypothetical protein
VWQRDPRGGKHRLTLAEGPLAPIAVDANCPEVVVQGLVRRRSDHWCIPLFLVNEQQEPEKRQDTGWAFQPELVAEGGGVDERPPRRGVSVTRRARATPGRRRRGPPAHANSGYKGFSTIVFEAA